MITVEYLSRQIQDIYSQSPIVSEQLGSEKWNKVVLNLDGWKQVTTVEANGYQSWSVSKAYHRGQRDEVLSPWTRPIWSYCHMQYYGDYLIRPKQEDVVSHGYILLQQEDTYLLIGHANPSEVMCQFGWRWHKGLTLYFENSQSNSKPALVFLQGEKTEVLTRYATQFKVTLNRDKIRGWTSWYQHYQNINEELVRSHVQAFAQSSLPINLIQIDDGWQREIGDWRPNNAFPDFESLTSEIRDHYEYAGIWLAPFICSENSRIFKNHRHWIKKKQDGSLLGCARQPEWGGVAYVLDLDLAEVRAFIFGILRNLMAKGFNFFKIDFIYAAAYSGNGKTRAQRLTMAMELLRSALGKSKLLACGVPLFQTVGFADYVRIGPDIGNHWEDWMQARLLKYPERVSTKMAIETCQTRSWVDGSILNADPDVFVLRKSKTSLSPSQKEALVQSVKRFESMRLTSDHPEQWHISDMELIKDLFQ